MCRLSAVATPDDERPREEEEEDIKTRCVSAARQQGALRPERRSCQRGGACLSIGSHSFNSSTTTLHVNCVSTLRLTNMSSKSDNSDNFDGQSAAKEELNTKVASSVAADVSG